MQCDNLIASAHRTDGAGAPLFQLRDREQITVAAFLNMFIAWEGFLESATLNLMAGESTISGRLPTRRVLPATISDAAAMIKGVMQRFDYSNHQNVRTIVNMYFEQGFPYEPCLSAMYEDLSDMKTIRNSCAHITATTQVPLATLGTKIAGQPIPNLTVYKLLTMTDSRPHSGGTVFESYKSKLMAAAQLIATG